LTIGILDSIVASIILQFIDKILGTEIFNSFLNIFLTPFVWIYKVIVLDILTKIYVLILILITGVLVTVIFLYFTTRNSFNQGGFLPPFINYTEAKFKDLYYRWEWKKTYEGKYYVYNISPMYPKCKCHIVFESCPNCNESYYGRILDDKAVEALTQHRIEKNKS
jgi:hypothetical protein